MEDLSLDAAAQCLLRTVERSRVNRLIGAASPLLGSHAQDECQSMECDAESHIETLAAVQLRNLEAKLVGVDSVNLSLATCAVCQEANCPNNWAAGSVRSCNVILSCMLQPKSVTLSLLLSRTGSRVRVGLACVRAVA